MGLIRVWNDEERHHLDEGLKDVSCYLHSAGGICDIIDRFAERFSGDITIVEIIYSEWMRCFEYALGLKTPLGNKELNKILAEQFREKRSLEEGNFVLYQDRIDGSPTHIARYMGNGFALSKWVIGPVVRHEVWQVPLSYGDPTRYLERLKTSSPALSHSYRQLPHS